MLLTALVLAGCGFHLRGSQSVNLPPAYQTLRFNAPAAYTETASLLQNALIERAGVRIKNDNSLPVFVLMGEAFERRVLSVNVVTGTATDYLLVYRLSYGLQDARGKDVMPVKQIYLQRDFRYDASDALGMQRESERLQNEMRLSAVDRVVQQLGYMTETLKPETGKSDTSEPETSNSEAVTESAK